MDWVDSLDLQPITPRDIYLKRLITFHDPILEGPVNFWVHVLTGDLEPGGILRREAVSGLFEYEVFIARNKIAGKVLMRRLDTYLIELYVGHDSGPRLFSALDVAHG